jgi:hypothetical protein
VWVRPRRRAPQAGLNSGRLPAGARRQDLDRSHAIDGWTKNAQFSIAVLISAKDTKRWPFEPLAPVPRLRL